MNYMDYGTDWHHAPARLGELPVVGGRFPDGRDCPATAPALQLLLDARRRPLDLPVGDCLLPLVSHTFLPGSR
jgi:hypothetical protein